MGTVTVLAGPSKRGGINTPVSAVGLTAARTPGTRGGAVAAPPGGARGTAGGGGAGWWFAAGTRPPRGTGTGTGGRRARPAPRQRRRPLRRLRMRRRPCRHAIGCATPGGAADWPGGSAAIGGRRCRGRGQPRPPSRLSPPPPPPPQRGPISRCCRGPQRWRRAPRRGLGASRRRPPASRRRSRGAGPWRAAVPRTSRAGRRRRGRRRRPRKSPRAAAGGGARSTPGPASWQSSTPQVRAASGPGGRVIPLRGWSGPLRARLPSLSPLSGCPEAARPLPARLQGAPEERRAPGRALSGPGPAGRQARRPRGCRRGGAARCRPRVRLPPALASAGAGPSVAG